MSKLSLYLGPSNLNYSKSLKEIKKIVSAKEMMNEVKKSLPVDIAVCAAAVSDFKPVMRNKKKIKKNSSLSNKISLEKNPDILDYLSKNNKARPKLVVGFQARNRQHHSKFKT